MYTQIIAHRGSRSTHPENTLEAFREALRVGSDGIELDVHLSQDGEVVVIHDETTIRTTGVSGVVGELTLEELKNLDAGSWFNESYSACKIPSLKEVLSLLEQEKFTGVLNIELKTDKTDYIGLSKKVYELVNEKSRSFSTIYSSFRYATLIELKELNSQNKMALLFRTDDKAVLLLERRYLVEAWHPEYKWAMLKIKKGDVPSIPMRVWTVNEEEDLRYFIDVNVAAIITDFPEKAIKIRTECAIEEKKWTEKQKSLLL